MKRLAILGLAILVAGTAWQNAAAQQRGRGFGRGGGSLGLLSQESVQKELQISDEQKQKVADYMAKQRESFSGLQDLSREERQAEFAKMQKASEEELGKILDAKQLARLKQIALQQRGVQALSDPQVANALTLTDDQKAKVATIQQELREQMGEVFQAGGADGDREEARKKIEAAQAGANEKLQAVLTADQQTKWKELNGEPFKGEIVRRGGGPGAGGQRRPGRQNRGAEISRPQNPFQLASFRANDDDDDEKKSAGKQDDDDDDKKAVSKQDDDDKPQAKHGKKKGQKHAKQGHKHKHGQAGRQGPHHGMHARHGGQHRRGHGQPSFGRRPMGGPNAAVWNHVAERMGGRGMSFGHHPPMGAASPCTIDTMASTGPWLDAATVGPVRVLPSIVVPMVTGSAAANSRDIARADPRSDITAQCAVTTVPHSDTTDVGLAIVATAIRSPGIRSIRGIMDRQLPTTDITAALPPTKSPRIAAQRVRTTAIDITCRRGGSTTRETVGRGTSTARATSTPGVPLLRRVNHANSVKSVLNYRSRLNS